MIDPSKPIRDDQLEAYLDGALDDADRAAIDEILRTDANLRRQVELQARIDSSLARVFRIEAPAADRVAAMLTAASRNEPRAPASSVRLGWAAAILIAAAGIGWLIGANPFTRSGKDDRFFAARPLTELYQESVANGFEPGYQCEDADRFAAAFERRQGVPLKLLRLPVGMKMLGLAYIGGLSPDTTAMLAQVDGQQVMVFVDRADVDQPDVTSQGDDRLHVFRQDRDGLVFYEVTPLGRPRMIEFLAPVSAEGESELPRSKPAA